MEYMVNPDGRPLVRYATPDDVPWIMGMAKEFFDVSEYRNLEWDYHRCLTFVLSLIDCDNGEKCLLVAVDSQDIPRGMVWGYGAIQPFLVRPIATELVWYVQPDYRASRMGRELLGAFERWAKGCGYHHVLTGVQEPFKAVLEPFYIHRMYKPIEHYYIKELK
jgi:GNAT superfamily N-acetyltransferase